MMPGKRGSKDWLVMSNSISKNPQIVEIGPNGLARLKVRLWRLSATTT
jgi:hypothetical protein